MHTVYIVPAWTKQASQCHIVAREGVIENPGRSYKESPDLWAEIGIMNSRGELVCLSATSETYSEVKSCETLMAGTAFLLEGINVTSKNFPPHKAATTRR